MGGIGPDDGDLGGASGKVSANPAADHELPRVLDDGEHVHLTYEQLEALADAAGEHRPLIPRARVTLDGHPFPDRLDEVADALDAGRESALAARTAVPPQGRVIRSMCTKCVLPIRGDPDGQ